MLTPSLSKVGVRIIIADSRRAPPPYDWHGRESDRECDRGPDLLPDHLVIAVTDAGIPNKLFAVDTRLAKYGPSYGRLLKDGAWRSQDIQRSPCIEASGTLSVRFA